MGITRQKAMRAAGLLMAGLSTGAMAAPPPFAICNDLALMDRDRLALAALSEAGVSAYPIMWVSRHAGADQVGRLLLGSENFCETLPLADAGIPRCGKDDAQKIGDAQNLIISVLRDRANYDVPSSIGSAASLYDASALTIRCRVTSDGQAQAQSATPIPPPFDFKRVPLRLRGSTDGLQFDRNLDAAFAGVEKANFSFANDDELGKKTFKAAAVVGVVFRPRPGVFEIVPFAGFSTDTSKKNGEDKEISARSYRMGVLFDVRSHGTGISHLFSIRPEYIWNRKEKSEQIAAALIYTPVINGRVNDAINVTTAGRSLFSIIPRADVRLIGGHFTRLGDRLEENAKDYARLGGQLGVTFTSDVKWLPVELTVTETYLRAIEAEPDHLSYLKGVLSVYFDEKKYFGVDVGYARGRRDDLLNREDTWTAGFAAKF